VPGTLGARHLLRGASTPGIHDTYSVLFWTLGARHLLGLSTPGIHAAYPVLFLRKPQDFAAGP
jgi:hypothetical protein